MADKDRTDRYLTYAILAAVLLVAYLLFGRDSSRLESPVVKSRRTAFPTVSPVARPSRRAIKPNPRAHKSKPARSARLAIIIDDMGQDMDALRAAIKIGVPLDIAVMPGLTHSTEAAKLAKNAGFELLLHQPMQAKGDPHGLGPYALTSNMDKTQLERTLSTALASVPGAAGVNNHMGSSLTADRAAMTSLMQSLKKRVLSNIVWVS